MATSTAPVSSPSKDEDQKTLSTSTVQPTLALACTGIGSIVHLPASALRHAFTGRNLYHCRKYIERTLKPRRLDGHLTQLRSKEEDSG